MNNYIQHLQQLSNPQTFKRKKEYIDYNLKSYFKEIGFRDIEVLEIGPGLGELEAYLNERGVFLIDIVDNDKSVLNYVTKKYKIKNSFLIKGISKLDQKISQYDLILLMQVLEHLPVNQQSKILKILYKHLNKNGFLAVVAPNGNNPLGLVERYGDIQHTTCFTEQSFKDLINISGIKNYEIKIIGYEIPPYSLLNIIRIFLQKVLHIFLLMVMIINGGTYFKVMTPNIMLVIKKVED